MSKRTQRSQTSFSLGKKCAMNGEAMPPRAGIAFSLGWRVGRQRLTGANLLDVPRFMRRISIGQMKAVKVKKRLKVTGLTPSALKHYLGWDYPRGVDIFSRMSLILLNQHYPEQMKTAQIKGPQAYVGI